MDLDFLLQVSKLLNTSKDLSRSLNMVLILLQEYHGMRNPMLLLKDSVTNKYFIELAPELDEEEKTHWNKELAESCPFSRFKLFYEMVVLPRDLANYKLPHFFTPKGKETPVFVHPLEGRNRGMPLGYLYVALPRNEGLDKMLKLLRLISGMLALNLEAHGLKTEMVYQTPERPIPTVLNNVVAVSGEMRKLAEMVKKIAPSRANVLIRGESGTGKELIANSIHQHSLRHNAPFVSINCAALSDNLLESELFGHEKGAFTGAIQSRQGRFEIANGGTLFLDEIGDTSLEFQTKLLRVLQEGQFERLGSNKTLHVDVRIVCATNVALENAMQQGTFRQDLFYRLNVVSLKVPPLRERQEDIPLLVKYFLKQLNEEYQKNVQVPPKNLEAFQKRVWPGNIRELQNAVHSAFLMETDGVLNLNSVAHEPAVFQEQPMPMPTMAPILTALSQPEVRQEEVQAIQKALSLCGGVQLRAAEYLGITLRQLRYRIKKYNIPVRKIQV